MSAHLVTLLLMVSAVLVAPLTAGSKPDKKASVSFHIQTDGNDNPKMIFAQPMNGQNMHFRRSPEVSTRDIAAYSPFPAEGGGGFGAVFRLKKTATGRLAAITNASQGRWLAAMANGRIVDGVLIDKQINDGVLVIWNGLTLEDIAAFDETLPRTDGQAAKKN